MKVLLAYPPDRCLPTIPYSSLAALKACLVQAGHEVAIRDLNVEVFDFLVKRDRLEGYYKYAEERVRDLESVECLDEAQTREYKFLAPLSAVPRDRMLRAEEAISIMRDKERFYDPDAFIQAFDDLQTTIRFLYSANPVFDPEAPGFIQKNLEALEGAMGDPVVDAYRGFIIEEILREKPDLVGLTLPFSFQFFEALKFVKVLKDAAPDVKVVIGGPTVNDYPDILFGDGDIFSLVDFGVAGEGEKAIVSLAAAVENGTSLDEVPNLIFSKDGKMKKSAAPPDLPDLNSLPTPDFTGIPFDRYLTPEPLANMQTSRGCYYGKCTFCGDGFRRNFRMRRPNMVYDDINKIHTDAGVKFFLFWDSLAPPRTLKAVAEGVVRDNLDVYWFAETKFEKPYANPDLIDLLYKGGCRFLQFGFESASQRVLDLIDKGNDLYQVDKILQNMKNTGLKAGCSWFIGFPTETRDEAFNTFEFVASRQDRIFLSVYAGTFMLGRDTLVYSDPERYGIRLKRTMDGSADYELLDGSQHYDRTEMDYAFRARGDLPLLNHGGYLHYATFAPDKLRKVTGLGRFGTLPKYAKDRGVLKPSLAETIQVSRFRYDFTSGDELSEGPIDVAYSAISGHHFALSEAEAKLVALSSGERSINEIARVSDLPDEEAHQAIILLIDRGILSVPPESVPAPELQLLTAQ